MKKIIAPILLLLFFCFIKGFSLIESSSGEKTDISIISTTSIKDSLPYNIFEEKTWEADPDSKFVKIDFLFDKPVKLGGLKIELGNDLTEAVTVFLNIQDAVYTVIPHNGEIDLPIPFKPGINSVNINFGRNNNVSIKGVHFFDDKNNEITVNAARAIKGNVTATSTLDPVLTYNIWNIFDSRLENGWSSNHKKSGDSIEFRFERPQTISALKFWNGYQRSKVHFDANSRFRTMKIEDDKGFSQTVKFEDRMGMQEIQLAKTLNGNYLKMTVLDSYAGSAYKDLVFSELRFYDGKRYFLIDPADFIKENIKLNREAFLAAGVGYILDQSIEMPEEGPDSSDLRFRFRSDGSVYAEGSIIGEKANEYFVVGNYEVLKSDPSGGINLRMFGYIVTQEGELISTGGGDCGGGGGEYQYKNSTKRIFTEFITISKADSNSVWITNTGNNHHLNFDRSQFDIE